MAQAGIRTIAIVSVTALALAGCTAGGGPLAPVTSGAGAPDGADAAVARAATPTRLVDRDVEAPEVFQATDTALWDGRPSLGGVWVASPDAVDPERVVIRNPANGRSVIGALFRRERLNPGPPLQISSDAAAALGILAGQPAEISVIALRRGEAAAATPGAPAAAVPPAPGAAADVAALGAAATAAIDRAAAAPAAGAADEGTAAGTPADAAEAAAPAAEDTPRERRKKRRAARAAAAAAAAEAEAEAAAAAAAAEAEAEAAAAAAAVPAGAAATARPGRPAMAPEAIAVAALADPPAAGAPAKAAPAAAPRAASAGGGLIQIGIFSLEANAQRAVGVLGKAGVSARVLTEQSQGKTFWRVVAGPGADAATLGKVKSAGFADAYFVKG
jgi:hypothetical protein